MEPSIPAGHRGAKQTENAKHRELGWSEEEASLLRSQFMSELRATQLFCKNNL
jgi:hypothetical protein